MTKIADRYKKALVTVGMGFRTEDDIKKMDYIDLL